jgi:hypothetical protein
VAFFVANTSTDGKLAEHNCSIPLGTSILFPILNVACNSLEDPNGGLYGKNDHEQRECSKGYMDTAIDLEVNIDGKKLTHPEQYRVASPKGGFKFTAVAHNPFATPPGHGTGVSDGFWILTGPLSPGKHKISFNGILDFNGNGKYDPNDDYQAGAIYNLDVKAKYYNNDYLKSLTSDRTNANANSPMATMKDITSKDNSNQPANNGLNEEASNELNEAMKELPNFLDLSSALG